MEIRPIETVYNGYRFRSRLEARWAVFFDAAGIEYQYEPEGFNIDGVYYLPDFYLPNDDVWVEIKGKALSSEEREKIEKFCAAKCDITKGGSRFRLLRGEIPNELIGINENVVGIPAFSYISPDEMGNANDKIGLGLAGKLKAGVLLLSCWIPRCSREIMVEALMAARQARFEHGETPQVKPENCGNTVQSI